MSLESPYPGWEITLDTCRSRLPAWPPLLGTPLQPCGSNGSTLTS